MSQERLQKAKDRLVNAKQEMDWVLNNLNDPATYLKQLNLTQEEEDELFQESYLQVAEIQSKLTQILTKRKPIKVGNKQMTLVGPIPPGLGRILLFDS